MAEHFTIKGEEYALVNCCTCGVRYLIPRILNDRALETREKGATVKCPNGHEWLYRGETEETRQRRRAERAEQNIACLKDELAAAERREKKLKRRAAAGTCPCCHRSFSNMSRHMKMKHPEFVADNVVKLKA